MLLANQSRKKFAGELQQQDAHDETGEKLKEVQLLINRLEFEQAKIQTRKICQAHPNDPRPWQQLFDLHKGQPRHKAFHQLVFDIRSEEHTSELQSRGHLVCRLLLEKKKQ